MSEKVVATLDEKNVSTLDTWLTSLFTARHLWPDVYLKHLTKVIGTIGQHGNALIVGRGAQFILPLEQIFRLRFIAPLEQRIAKVMKDRKYARDEAEGYVIKTEADRAAFIKKYFREDIADPSHYDLVLNTAGLSVDQAAEIVKASFRAKFP
jgi:cytidylate kinase